jgi:hypothetical protein
MLAKIVFGLCMLFGVALWVMVHVDNSNQLAAIVLWIVALVAAILQWLARWKLASMAYFTALFALIWYMPLRHFLADRTYGWVEQFAVWGSLALMLVVGFTVGKGIGEKLSNTSTP